MTSSLNHESLRQTAEVCPLKRGYDCTVYTATQNKLTCYIQARKTAVNLQKGDTYPKRTLFCRRSGNRWQM
jgi:hypothetical protein